MLIQSLPITLVKKKANKFYILPTLNFSSFYLHLLRFHILSKLNLLELNQNTLMTTSIPMYLESLGGKLNLPEKFEEENTIRTPNPGFLKK